MPDKFDLLTRARTEALFASTVETGATLNREATDRAIRDATRAHHGIRGCAAKMGGAYGESPHSTVVRLQWARRTVLANYP
ncbi:hypothetical protein Lesp02_02060 [Lentzea sp. NBRC 105346]|uniref:hypothetical protein n=1 Tax=Lentzea sp. NBRC 105346 TaxID=3032205 RepID=UPI0024A2AA28|nr:hypothetical protein [Lentzea sp. NBRC 105346]GLZ28016.1 hypothetical protein Lesp02_02060 [Lentzea sp. NBRC 105346]